MPLDAAWLQLISGFNYDSDTNKQLQPRPGSAAVAPGCVIGVKPWFTACGIPSSCVSGPFCTSSMPHVHALTVEYESWRRKDDHLTGMRNHSDN